MCLCTHRLQSNWLSTWSREKFDCIYWLILYSRYWSGSHWDWQTFSTIPVICRNGSGQVVCKSTFLIESSQKSKTTKIQSVRDSSVRESTPNRNFTSYKCSLEHLSYAQNESPQTPTVACLCAIELSSIVSLGPPFAVNCRFLASYRVLSPPFAMETLTVTCLLAIVCASVVFPPFAVEIPTIACLFQIELASVVSPPLKSLWRFHCCL